MFLGTRISRIWSESNRASLVSSPRVPVTVLLSPVVLDKVQDLLPARTEFRCARLDSPTIRVIRVQRALGPRLREDWERLRRGASAVGGASVECSLPTFKF